MRAEYAEDVGHYLDTSRSDPGAWIDRAAREVEEVGGRVLGHAFGMLPDRSGPILHAYMLRFELDGQRYSVVWPVLPCRPPGHRGRSRQRQISELAARRQAATALYYEVKSRCVAALMIGSHRAFFSYLMLPDGRTAGELTADEATALPPQIVGQRLLAGGDER